MKNHFTFHKSALIAVSTALIFTTLVFAASGDLDTTFSGDGKIIQTFRDSWAQGNDLAVQADGKLVVVGNVEKMYQDIVDIAIIRYNTNGTLDKTFSGDGRLLIRIEYWNYAQGVTIQTDGKIVVVGKTCWRGDNSACDLVVIRLNSNGTKDLTFNGNGVVRKDLGGKDNDGYRVKMQGTKIVVVGSVSSSTSAANGVIYRFLSNGKLDTTFSVDGIQYINYGGDEFLSDIAIYAGKIYVTGKSIPPDHNSSSLIAARVNINGTLDTTFSGDGILMISLGSYDGASGIAIQSDGKVVLAGQTCDIYTACSAALVRLTSTGELDTTFSGDGIQTDDFGFTRVTIKDLTIQAGNIIIAGTIGASALIARYTTAGDLDTTFSTDGIVTTDWAGGDDSYASIAFKNSRLYVTGTSNTYDLNARLCVAVYLP